jgi:hypothetical protein
MKDVIDRNTIKSRQPRHSAGFQMEILALAI